ncbi:MAG: hypothetical protein N4A57_13810 [Anaeromicrobium sp.]|jgi:hypothetical protein|uniref:hypothetical protein n=1 Tax=Anaeromicrobium sp. TaxID=1929132 RepID=UPI0025D4C0A5|nr:hypothetical protein [Anaeromicrobium sp.]MCT4595321.1 hypothetical protein [Anaeromicrobium sp.]
MQTLGITILHTLSGRLRLSLSWPPKNVEKFEKDVMGHAGIYSVKYSPITKSILIHYNPSEVDASEILIRVGLAVSVDHDLTAVEISTKTAEKEFHSLDRYAGISLTAAWAMKLTKLPLGIQNFLKWNAALSSIGSIIYHAWSEVKSHGVYDPEVLSVVYLINAMKKENFLPATTGTWLTAFGRHLIDASGEKMILQAFKVYDKEQSSTYYDVAIMPKKSIKDGKDLVGRLIYSMTKSIGLETSQIGWMKQMKNVSRSHGDILEGIGKLDNRIFLRLKY